MGKKVNLHWTFLCVCLFLLAGQAVAEDWPAWRGPNRDGICRETGLLKEWPQEGPKLLWKVKGMGEGFSGPAVVGRQLYTMGNGNGKEWVVVRDAATGKPVWASATGKIRHGGGGYPGPRSTPTIDGQRLYTLGINGDLVCMDIRRGAIVWHHKLVEEFGGEIPQWGYSESVLVDGPWVLCTPGKDRLAKGDASSDIGRAIGRLVVTPQELAVLRPDTDDALLREIDILLYVPAGELDDRRVVGRIAHLGLPDDFAVRLVQREHGGLVFAGRAEDPRPID